MLANKTIGQSALKAETVDLVGLFLDWFDETRGPDLWERAHLAMAIHLLRNGAYSLALLEIQLASTPHARRPPVTISEDDPVLSALSIELLREAFAKAVGDTLRQPPFLFDRMSRSCGGDGGT